MTTLVIGAIRLIVIWIIGARIVRIISGNRAEDKLSDLVMEIGVVFATVLAIDALILILVPTGALGGAAGPPAPGVIMPALKALPTFNMFL